MQKINLSDENKVREKVFRSAAAMAKMIGITLGPSGRSVIIERGVGEPLIVDDGRRVAENMKFDDPIEHLVARSLYSVTRKTDEKVGDGTTTSICLTDGMMTEIAKTRISFGGMTSGQAMVNEVDQEIREAKKVVLEKLDKMARPIKTEKDLIDVATISSGDPVLGEMIGKIYHKLGKDGHIALEFNLLGDEVEYEVVPGLRFSGAYAERWMVTNAIRGESVFSDVHVLVTNRKDLDVEQVKPIASEVQNSGKSSMVIIAPRFTADFLKAVYRTATQPQGRFEILCVRAPGLHSEHYEDIAIWTGGRAITDEDDISQVTKKDLGYVQRIEVTDEICVLIEGKGDKKAVKKRIEEVRADANNQKIPQFKQIRLDRISSLNGGVAVIRIGAPTDEERNWLKHKIEDAKYATKQAFISGVVPGGGMAFKTISEELPEGNILKNAILAPYNKLKENAGGKFTVGKNVIDPLSVEKAALENACSAVGKLIRIGGAIALKPRPLLDEAFRGIIGNNDGIQEDDDSA